MRKPKSESNKIVSIMTKKELKTIADSVQSAEQLRELEPQITKAVQTAVELELLPLGGNTQDLVNKCVNAFAKSLREEIGIRDAESMKMLERVRVVSERTIQRDKQKTKNNKND
jgi:hypothetical protein